MSLVFLDVETTGLDPRRHEVWEIAYAVDDGPVQSSIVAHHFREPDPAALRVNRYLDRTAPPRKRTMRAEVEFEADVADALRGATIVGANPAFDAAFLSARWQEDPWHHRLLDVEAYAMGALGYDAPKGLARVAQDLRDIEYDIPEPDHTAARDVECVRACYFALRDLYQSAFIAAHGIVS